MALILSLVFTPIMALSYPQSVRAQSGGGSGMTVPIGTDFDFNNIMAHMKDFILDKAAYLLAKQILHQMTTSIVNWINTGFKGSPSFLTNPEGFFLDAADQVTGEFLASNGALSRLCSPFSLDIRLALALDQTVSASKRYTCTLGKIISAQKGTIEGFTNGDFRQGGWPAFISLTMEPQNNRYGSYLQARSDLFYLINKKNNTINTDLNRGRGFLSWQKCNDISEQAAYARDASVSSDDAVSPQFEDLQTRGYSAYGKNSRAASLDTGNGSSITAIPDGQGGLKYQNCQTQTPGSVIQGSLQKAVDSPIVEGELADDINAILNALVSQMINKMLSEGLSGLSKSGSSGKTSYTQQIIRDIDAQKLKEAKNTRNQLSALFDGAFASLNEYKSAYDQAVAVISNSRVQYLNARTCFTGKIGDPRYGQSDQGNLQNYIARINLILTTTVDPLLAQLSMKQASTTDKLAQLQKLRDQTSSSGADSQDSQFDSVQNSISLYEAGVRNSIEAQSVTQTGMTDAQKDLKDAQTKATTFNANAQQYQQACLQFPNVYGNLNF